MLKDFQHENQFSSMFNVIDVRVSYNFYQQRRPEDEPSWQPSFLIQKSIFC